MGAATAALLPGRLIFLNWLEEPLLEECSKQKSEAPQMRLANLNAPMWGQCVAIPCPLIFTFEEPQLLLVFQNALN